MINPSFTCASTMGIPSIAAYGIEYLWEKQCYYGIYLVCSHLPHSKARFMTVLRHGRIVTALRLSGFTSAERRLSSATYTSQT